MEPRLFLTNPVAMAWRPDGSDAWVVVQNSDVVVRLTVNSAGIPTIGAPLASGPGAIVRVDLQKVDKREIPGKAPRGIVIDSTGRRAFISNFVSRSVTAVDISNPAKPEIESTARSTALPRKGSREAIALLGAELFFTGRGPDGRMSQESWGGCITCHPGGRSDNVTWMFEAGPRQTVPLDGMFDKNNPHDQRILNWSAVRDENQDFELNTRGIFGGRGLIDDDRLFFAIGGTAGTAPNDLAIIEQFQQATGAVTATNDLAKGKRLPSVAKALSVEIAVEIANVGNVAEVDADSDNGDNNEIEDSESRYEVRNNNNGRDDDEKEKEELRQTVTQGANVLTNVGTFTLGGGRQNEIRFSAADVGQAIAPLGANGSNIPSLLSAHETAPYFYSGLAQSLEEVLNGSQDTFGGVRHHFIADPSIRRDMIAFLRSIDNKTPTFP